jgi:hypothetical protein
LAAGGVPADDAAVEQITDAGEVELAVTARELGDVCDPSLVRCLGDEVAVQQIGQAAGVGPATPPLLRRMRSDQVVRAHQARHPRLRHPDPTPTQLSIDPWRAIGVARAPIDVGDDLEQLDVGSVAC